MPKLSKAKYFPPAELAESEGVVLFGGKLNNDWLLDAYSHGIFPWPIFDGSSIMIWWSPDPRAIFELDKFHCSRRLRRTVESGKFHVTCNQDFRGVIHGCATVGNRARNTWITPEMLAAYVQLHEAGHAHSIEVWHDGVLAGGTYGVAIGGLFAGESMFHRVTDASKVALSRLVEHLTIRGYTLFDIQQLTPHTASLGAREIRRADYLNRLALALTKSATFGTVLERAQPAVDSDPPSKAES